MKRKYSKHGILYHVLAPFAFMYGIVVGIYGMAKGMEKDEIIDKYLIGKYLYKRFNIKK